ncbi:MAG: chloride channel protein [Ignavibacteriaceae bacterium]|nr:chloride channel protein [Ignavibacteriaceae bacterium]
MKSKSSTKIFLVFKRLLPFIFHDPSNKTSVILLSILIGAIAGLIAVVLKSSVNFSHELALSVMQRYSIKIVFLLPLIGILLTVLFVQFFFKGIHTKGLSDIIHSIAKGKVDIPFQRTYSHIIASTLTVGLGGSVGLEAPIAATGAAIGANIGKSLKLNYKFKTLFIACGTAAGISAIFNSPIAGVIFAFEVLVSEISVPFLIPVLISSATAAVFSNFMHSGQLFILVTQGWQYKALPFYILLGVFCGLISVYTIRSTFSIEKYFHSIKNRYYRAILGGLGVSFLVFLFLPLFGEGYLSVKQVLSTEYYSLLQNSFFSLHLPFDWFLLLFVFLLIILKPIAAGLTVGAGGDGGIIAPSLFMGGMCGFFMAQLFRTLGIIDLITVNFIAVGMAGVLAGVIRAPLTGIFLIAEITGGYILFVPLMIVVSTAYFISKYFEKNSIYTKVLHEKGIDDVTNKDAALLSKISISELIEKDFSPVNPNATLAQFLEVMTHSKRNVFPVVDGENNYLGLIYLDDIREMILEKELYNILLVYEIMRTDNCSLSMDESMTAVIEKFEKFNAWNLPVVQEGKYIGFVSKSAVLTLYRKHVVQQAEQII